MPDEPAAADPAPPARELVLVAGDLGGRGGPAPRPDALRDSGAIEQVAKQIWMLHESKRDGDEILVLKDSGGEVGHIAVDFDRVSMTFRERAEQRPGGLHADDD